MKKILTVSAYILFISLAFSQSDSYITIKDTFKGGKDVYSFSVGGFLCRAILSWTDEAEWGEAITDVKNVRFTVVPKEQFEKRNVTLNGFKKILAKDSFHELGHVRDNGSLVSFYIQQNGIDNDRYFILVDDRHEVVAIEMRGYVDMNKVLTLASNEN